MAKKANSTTKAKPRAAAKPRVKKEKVQPDSRKAEVSAESPRDEKGRIKKGFTINAGGMPKGMGEVKKLARQYTERAIMTLVEIMEDKDKSGPARVGAATALLDRGYGRPVQQLEVGKPGDFSDMAEPEIDAFIAKASGQLAHLRADGFAVH